MEKKEKNIEEGLNIKALLFVILGLLLICLYSGYKTYKDYYGEDSNIFFIVINCIPALACVIFIVLYFIVMVCEIKIRRKGEELLEEDKNWCYKLRDKFIEINEKEETAQEIIDSVKEDKKEFIDFSTLLVIFLVGVAFILMFMGSISVQYDYKSNFTNDLNQSANSLGETFGKMFYDMSLTFYNLGIKNPNIFYFGGLISLICFIACFFYLGIRHSMEMFRGIYSLFKKMKGGKKNKNEFNSMDSS